MLQPDDTTRRYLARAKRAVDLFSPSVVIITMALPHDASTALDFEEPSKHSMFSPFHRSLPSLRTLPLFRPKQTFQQHNL